MTEWLSTTETYRRDIARRRTRMSIEKWNSSISAAVPNDKLPAAIRPTHLFTYWSHKLSTRSAIRIINWREPNPSQVKPKCANERICIWQSVFAEYGVNFDSITLRESLVDCQCPIYAFVCWLAKFCMAGGGDMWETGQQRQRSDGLDCRDSAEPQGGLVRCWAGWNRCSRGWTEYY